MTACTLVRAARAPDQLNLRGRHEREARGLDRPWRKRDRLRGTRTNADRISPEDSNHQSG